jgi:hypothetical protein
VPLRLLEAHLIASPPTDPKWDQLAGFVTGSNVSLLCISRIVYKDRRYTDLTLVGMMPFPQKRVKKKAKHDQDTAWLTVLFT